MGLTLIDPLFLIDALPPGDTAVLAGDEGRHAAKVRRVRVGERVDVTDGAGGLAMCTARVVGADFVELDVGERRYDPPSAPRLVVVQALPKGDRGELAVELMTELGVDEIVPWSAHRSVVSWRGDRAAKPLSRWRATARAATKQSRRTWLPVVLPPHDTAGVAERLRNAAVAIALHESATTGLSTVDLPAVGDVVLVIGPEGGIAPEELTAFEAAGASARLLGPLVLRTSTAGAAALAALSAGLGRWS